MQIVETVCIKCRPDFEETYKKYFKMLSAEILTLSAKS